VAGAGGGGAKGGAVVEVASKPVEVDPLAAAVPVAPESSCSSTASLPASAGSWSVASPGVSSSASCAQAVVGRRTAPGRRKVKNESGVLNLRIKCSVECGSATTFEVLVATQFPCLPVV